MLFRSCLSVCQWYKVVFKITKRSSITLIILKTDTERSLFNAEVLALFYRVLHTVDNRWKTARVAVFGVGGLFRSVFKCFFPSDGTDNLHLFIVSYYVLIKG
jgi:hypothetical protein